MSDDVPHSVGCQSDSARLIMIDTHNVSYMTLLYETLPMYVSNTVMSEANISWVYIKFIFI